jgi:LPS sulfotransferase NodH
MTVGVAGKPSGRIYDLLAAEHDYAPWDGPSRRTILICTHPRSGSTLLGEALYFAGGLGCPLEYYHAGFRPAPAGRWQAPNIAEYAAAVTRNRTEPNGTLAVKLFWRDVVDLAIEIDPTRFGDLWQSMPDETTVETYREIADLLRPLFPNPLYVHLQRRDRVRQAISTVTAADTGRWRFIPNLQDREPAGVPRFDLDRIEQKIATADFCHNHWRNFFAAVDARPHSMSYEDLNADYTAAVTKVLRFLGSHAAPPPIRMRRQADEVSESVILRYLRERAKVSASC